MVAIGKNYLTTALNVTLENLFAALGGRKAGKVQFVFLVPSPF